MYGSVQLDDEQSMDTSFVMSDECVVIEAQYVLLEAKITTKEGVVTMYEDVNEAMMQWQEEGSTLTLLQPIEYSLFFFDLPDQGILDLGGNRLSMMEWDRAKTLYIKNGAIILDLQNQEICEQTTLSFENVALSTREEGEFIIDNQGMIKDEDGLVVADNITIIGNKINYRIDWDSDAAGVADITAPAASVQIDPVRIDRYEVSIHAWDEGSGIRSIVYMISDKPLSASELRKWKQWNSYTDPIVIDTAGTSIVYARIEDQEGNVTYVHSDAIRIETQTDSVQSGTSAPTSSLYLWSGIISALALFMTVKKRRKS